MIFSWIVMFYKYYNIWDKDFMLDYNGAIINYFSRQRPDPLDVLTLEYIDWFFGITE